LSEPVELVTEVNPIAVADLEPTDLFQQRLEVVKAADGGVILSVDPGDLLADRTQQKSFFQPVEGDLLDEPAAGQLLIGRSERSRTGDPLEEHSFDLSDKGRLG
jgi:hypothetical protein